MHSIEHEFNPPRFAHILAHLSLDLIWNTLAFWVSLCVSCTLAVTMVMKSAVDDDDTGWGLGIPEKMKNNANWVDITHEFKGACKGKALLLIVFLVVVVLVCITL